MPRMGTENLRPTASQRFIVTCVAGVTLVEVDKWALDRLTIMK